MISLENLGSLPESAFLSPAVDAFYQGVDLWGRQVSDQPNKLSPDLKQELLKFAKPAAAKKLDQDDCRLVLTGQQPALGGGPLYSLYKINHAVKLAQHLEKESGCPHVAVYWNASDDHDFAEANRLMLSDPDAGTLTRHQLSWDTQNKALWRLPAFTSWDDLAQQLSLSSQEAGALPEFCQDLPRDHFGIYWGAFLMNLFNDDCPLTMVEPRQLRVLQVPLMKQWFETFDEVQAALKEGRDQVKAAGLDLPFEDGDDSFVFLDQDSGRYKLDIVDGQLQARGQSEKATAKQWSAHVDQDPQQFSPGVLLRVMVQDKILKPSHVVLGPGEIAYHASLGPLYRLLGIGRPVVVPREGFTLITKKEKRLMDKMSLDKNQLWNALIHRTPAPFQSAHQDQFAQLGDLVKQAVQQVKSIGLSFDQGQEKNFDRSARQIEEQWEKLNQRVLEAERASHGLSRDRFNRLGAMLWPMNRPQERVFGVWDYLKDYGPSFNDVLLKQSLLDGSNNHRLLLIS